LKMNLVKLALVLVFLSILGGCGKLKEAGNDAPPGRIVSVALFKSNCTPLVQEAVQAAFIDAFFTYTNAKPIKGENGYIRIEGIITIDEGQTGSSSGLILGGRSSVGGGSSSSAASGTYVTGITIQAYKGSDMIATYSVGQDLGKGKLVSPVSLAMSAARNISTLLVRQNEIGRK
jgi:hypothetical protein